MFNLPGTTNHKTQHNLLCHSIKKPKPQNYVLVIAFIQEALNAPADFG